MKVKLPKNQYGFVDREFAPFTSRFLKDQATSTEKLVRHYLKRYKAKVVFQKIIKLGNRKFRILDFYFPKMSVGLELDGEVHDFTSYQDAQRDSSILESESMKEAKKSKVEMIIRIKNDLIWEHYKNKQLIQMLTKLGCYKRKNMPDTDRRKLHEQIIDWSKYQKGIILHHLGN